jgi:hypothetical protein
MTTKPTDLAQILAAYRGGPEPFWTGEPNAAEIHAYDVLKGNIRAIGEIGGPHRIEIPDEDVVGRWITIKIYDASPDAHLLAFAYMERYIGHRDQPKNG